MIITNEMFIPIPKARNTQVKVEINGTDEKSKVFDSEWIKPATVGIGSFKIQLKNAFGRISNKYEKNQTVKFYFDNSDASRLQFEGRIDFVGDIINENGQFLEIRGRHKSWLLTETKVNHVAENADPADILKAIIAKLPVSYGFTTNNIKNVGITISKEWDYVDFWDCVKELCERSRFDCRVDNDLDFHFHKRDTIINYDEHIVEGLNHRGTDKFGTDDYQEKTRVTGIGQDDAGISIIYTAKSPNEKTEIREGGPVKDTSANTLEKVKALAKGKLLELTNRPPQATFRSYGLETLEPGEDIWIVVMRQKIYGIFRVLTHTFRYGSKRGGVRSEVRIEKENIGVMQIMENILTTENKISKAQNVNKLEFSHNFNFNNDNLTESHSQTEVKDGLLVLSKAGFNDGTWVSDKLTADKNITQIELRYVGKDLTSSVFEFSLDTGINFQTFTGKEVLTTPDDGHVGKNIKCKIKLVKDSLNANPQLNSAALFFS